MHKRSIKIRKMVRTYVREADRIPKSIEVRKRIQRIILQKILYKRYYTKEKEAACESSFYFSNQNLGKNVKS